MEYHKTRKRKKRSSIQVLLEWSIGLLVALLVALFLTQVIIVNAQIPSASMEDTIRVNDRIIGLRLAYLNSRPERWDILIFKYPDDESQLYVKRVIGLPGETVEIIDGEIYLNGAFEALDDPYPLEPPEGNFGPYTVPEGSYFVMGDNRNNSWDSRYWEHTFVTDNEVVGKAVFRLWPDPGAIG